MADLDSIKETLKQGNIEKLKELVQGELDEGVAATEILNDGLVSGMDEVGAMMESGEMFIPEVLRSAKAMGAAVEILKPLLGEDEISASGKVVMGTVKGDLHDIGKNLVSMMLQSSGFEVFDLGVDVSPEQFVAAIKENDPDVVGFSALLTTTMEMMQKTMDAVVESGYRDQLKIIIGGAPVTQKFADEIGADGYAPDAGSAIKLAKSLVA
jgi:5-methyltetrahydrofolate--homocysteine methyltransferase